ncbi:MAG: hypothetical protein DRI56_01300 [Chloroflexota bacterium]|nr:MAG: hypothetical protein DRI56_01300 [Chloroflexota bacterium]
MNKLDVKIVQLEPMRVISAYGFGAEPEGIAWEKLEAFAHKKGLKMQPEGKSTFGFNNPNPSKGSPNYGYEVWLPVEKDIEPEDDLRVVDFEGGLYAVTKFKGLQNIGRVWGELAKWRESSKYKCGHHQWLEEMLTSDVPIEEFVFNLYLPIAE